MSDAETPIPEGFTAAIIGAGAMGLSLASLLGGCGLQTQYVEQIGPWVWAKGVVNTATKVADIRGGRPTEIGQLNGQIIEHARRVGVATPSHEVIAALTDAFDWRVFERGRPDASRDHKDKDVFHAFQY